MNFRLITQWGGPLLGAAPLRACRWAFGASLAVFLVGATFAYQMLSASWAAASVGPASAVGSMQSTFVTILSANLGTAVFLYSGAVTFGLTTIVGLGMLSAFVGATMKTGVTIGGWGALAGDTAVYALLEFLGFIVVAASGLYPVIATMVSGQGERSEPVLRRYLTALTVSLRVFALGVSIIVVAAVIETLKIHWR